MKKTVLISIVAIVFLSLIFSLRIIDTGCTGVVKTLGAPTGRVLTNGVHFKVPFIQTVEEVDTQIIKAQEPASAVSKDLQAIATEIAVNYRVLPGSAVDVVKKIGSKYLETEVIIPTMQEAVKAISAQYTAEDLISKRATVSIAMQKALQQKLDSYEFGIVIEGFNIINFDFSDTFKAAIEAKQVAAQNLIKVETEQKQLVVKANAKLAASKAEAEAVLVAAEAKAKANDLLNNSMTPNLIEWEKIQKWDGELPQAQGGTPIIDMRSSD